MHTGLGLQLQVQLVPLMQVFLRLDPSYHGQMCGEAPPTGREGAGARTQLQAAGRTGRIWQEVKVGRRLLPGHSGDSCTGRGHPECDVWP